MSTLDRFILVCLCLGVWIVGFGALALVDCHAAPAPVVPTPDASDAAPSPPAADSAAPAPTACVEACAALARAGCAEGSDPTCAVVLGHLDADRLVRTPSGEPLSCASLANVATVAQARAGGIACVDAGTP